MSANTLIYHFARPEDWQAAQASGEYLPREYKAEGFIHCATEAQIAGVVARHLRGGGQRLQLSIDAIALGDALHYEWSEASQDLYPHVYGAIPLSAVMAVTAFDPDTAVALP